MGFAPGQYSDYVVTIDNSTTVTIKDLINNATYYFAVVALDINGSQISSASQEVSATPYGSGLRPAASSSAYGSTSGKLSKVPKTEETGPETLWVIFASAVFAYFLYHHKRKLVFDINSKL